MQTIGAVNFVDDSSLARFSGWVSVVFSGCSLADSEALASRSANVELIGGNLLVQVWLTRSPLPSHTLEGREFFKDFLRPWDHVDLCAKLGDHCRGADVMLLAQKLFAELKQRGFEPALVRVAQEERFWVEVRQDSWTWHFRRLWNLLRWAEGLPITTPPSEAAIKTLSQSLAEKLKPWPVSVTLGCSPCLDDSACDLDVRGNDSLVQSEDFWKQTRGIWEQFQRDQKAAERQVWTDADSLAKWLLARYPPGYNVELAQKGRAVGDLHWA